MSLGSSDMTGSALGTVFSLLLLASNIQGRWEVEVFHNEKMEAVEGQDVTLPCTVKNSTGIQIVSIEWSKSNNNNNEKLVVFNPIFGVHTFWPNVTIQIENKSMGSNLKLSGVTKWDSGIYICDLSMFPMGSIKRETELTVKDADVKLMCDNNSTVEVHAGGNVTIHCTASPNAQFWWIKNKMLVSENEYLELLWVTDAHAGVYTLTVETGSKYLHTEFIITVVTATTSLKTDFATVSPQPNVTQDGLTESADSGLTTSQSNGLSTIDTNVTWTMSTDTDVTDGEHKVSYTSHTHISDTSSPATHTDPYHFNYSTDQEINTSTTSDQAVASNLSTTHSYGSTLSTSTQETLLPGVNSSTSPDESSTLRNITENSDNCGANRTGNILDRICDRKMINNVMDLPPPFKPPPPPVKYTSARHCEISTQPFPTSRCNSISEPI
uniref:Ig-like domain-containing protein n=1 Tax=Dicentrarchus labrax TaxID=13489 RepID=A0A8C4DUB4_DICLA